MVELVGLKLSISGIETGIYENMGHRSKLGMYIFVQLSTCPQILWSSSDSTLTLLVLITLSVSQDI